MKTQSRSFPFVWWLNLQNQLIYRTELLIIVLLCYVQTLATNFKLKLYQKLQKKQTKSLTEKLLYLEILYVFKSQIRSLHLSEREEKKFPVCKKQELVITILYCFICVTANLNLNSEMKKKLHKKLQWLTWDISSMKMRVLLSI